jgi:hypothetical protein
VEFRERTGLEIVLFPIAVVSRDIYIIQNIKKYICFAGELNSSASKTSKTTKASHNFMLIK